MDTGLQFVPIWFAQSNDKALEGHTMCSLRSLGVEPGPDSFEAKLESAQRLFRRRESNPRPANLMICCSQKVNDQRNPDPKSTISESPQSVVMLVLIVFIRCNTNIDDDNQYVWLCPKIVGDTNVTVVVNVTVGCYHMYL
jgi:hypothetical protein